MCYKNIYPLLVVTLLTSSFVNYAQAAPVGVNLDFVGPGPNSLNLSASAQGTLNSELNGKAIFPFTGVPTTQIDPIGLNPDTITVSSAPVRDPRGGPTTAFPLETASINFDGANLWTPLDISNFNVELLNGAPFAFALDTLVLEVQTNPPDFFDPDSNFKIDLGGSFTSIKFFQNDGAAVFTGNTYAIPGELVGVVDLTVGIDVFGGSLALVTGLGTQEFSTPFTLEGTIAANNTTATDADLTFDGITSGSFALSGISLTENVNLAGLIVNLSLDVAGAIDLDFAYHLEDTAHVPEPGTFVLLGLGAVGLLPVIRRRMRKS